MNRSRTQVVALALAVSLLSACGGDGDDTATAPPPVGAPPPAAGGTAVTLTGKLTAPDATTPIANALVYVKDSTAAGTATQSSILAALPCGTPPTASWAATCTGADGAFSLAATVPASPTLVAVKGAFKLEKVLTVNAGGPVEVGTVALDANSAAKLAVVTGAYDHIQDVLAKLGYGQVSDGKLLPGTESFTLYDGDGSLDAPYKDGDALFADADGNGQPDIYNHSVVFFNCGLDEEVLSNPAHVATLRAYVAAGGRIYASDLAYDFVEQVFPQYVDFEGSVATAADQPENPGEAEVGDSGIESTADVDAGLAAWLQGVSCTNGPCVAQGKAHIEGFLSGWAVIAGTHPAQQAAVKTWVSGPVTFGAQATPVVRPLTVSFPHGLGRVTYTSYHTEPNEGLAGFLPQERILQFLVFEL